MKDTTLSRKTLTETMVLDSLNSAETVIAGNVTEAVPTLAQINNAEIIRLVPTIVFLGIISVTGVFGNGLVFHIYRTRYRLSNVQCFILCLSAIDLFTCSIVIPLAITVITNQYTFQHIWLCKFSRFFNAFSTMSTSFLLLFMAVDRYRRICQPFSRQISVNVAKFLCLFAVILGVLFSWPTVFIYGKKTFTIPKYNMTGTECSTDDSMVDSMYPFIYVLVYGGLFVSGILAVIILYCLIGREVYKHVETMPKEYLEASKSVSTLSLSVPSRMSRVDSEVVINKSDKYENSKNLNDECTEPTHLCVREDSDEIGCDPFDFHEQTVTEESIENEKVEEKENKLKERERVTEQQRYVNPGGENDDRLEVNNLNENQFNDQLEQDQVSKLANDTNLVTHKKSNTDVRVSSRKHSFCSSTGRLSPGQYSVGGKFSLLSRRMSSVLGKASGIRSRTSVSNNSIFSKTQCLNQSIARKTAFLMFIISLASVLSYVPHLMLMLIRDLNDEFVEQMTDTDRAVYKFFLRSYFLNFAINPIIYAVCASRFRFECRQLLNSLCRSPPSKGV